MILYSAPCQTLACDVFMLQLLWHFIWTTHISLRKQYRMYSSKYIPKSYMAYTLHHTPSMLWSEFQWVTAFCDIGCYMIMLWVFSNNSFGGSDKLNDWRNKTLYCPYDILVPQLWTLYTIFVRSNETISWRRPQNKFGIKCMYYIINVYIHINDKWKVYSALCGSVSLGIFIHSLV